MQHDIFHDKPAHSDPDAPAAGEQLTRHQAIQHIERRRRFLMRISTGTLGMVILTVIWAFAESHNAGGWHTTHGFSQSSGIPNVWNCWINYPAIAWVLLTAGDAWWGVRAPADLRKPDQARDRPSDRLGALTVACMHGPYGGGRSRLRRDTPGRESEP